ncbi:MAG TPA: hypothetical protein VJ011_05050 [Steroidobacteraceae bacterium]|nr:hypothetical protein [Steroidobacteraceae bacterium]
MKRALSILLGCTLCAAGPLPAAEVDEVRVEQLRQDVAELNRVVREQARRIERLEREIARLRAASTRGKPGPARDASADAEAVWVAAEAWKPLRPGLSEREVLARLGPPTAVRSDPPASKTLLYALELPGTGFLSGSVRLENGQVAEVREPQLR